MARKAKKPITAGAKRELELAREAYASEAAVRMRDRWAAVRRIDEARETAERFNWLRRMRREGKQ